MTQSSQHVVLKVEGMSCGGCVRRLDQGLRRVPGVSVEEVQVGNVRLNYDPAVTTMIVIENAIAELGFKTTILGT